MVRDDKYYIDVKDGSYPLMLPKCFLLAPQPSDNFKTSLGIVLIIMEPSAKVSGRTAYLKPI